MIPGSTLPHLARTIGLLAERWATTSQQRALANARAGAVAASQARLERAEVEQYLAGLAHPGAGAHAEAEAVSR